MWCERLETPVLCAASDVIDRLLHARRRPWCGRPRPPNGGALRSRYRRISYVVRGASAAGHALANAEVGRRQRLGLGRRHGDEQEEQRADVADDRRKDEPDESARGPECRYGPSGPSGTSVDVLRRVEEDAEPRRRLGHHDDDDGEADRRSANREEHDAQGQDRDNAQRDQRAEEREKVGADGQRNLRGQRALVETGARR